MAKGMSNSLQSNGIEMIPGMGIVRIRCLRKAGWDTVESLGSATVEQIAAVPGIGEAKAREIREFLDALAGSGAQNGAVRRKKAIETPAPRRAEDRSREVTGAVARVAQLASDLLSAPISHSFERPLARQVGRIAALEAPSGGAALKAGRAERALGQLKKIESILTEVAHEERLGKKRQERLTEELRDRRRKARRALETAGNKAESGKN